MTSPADTIRFARAALQKAFLDLHDAYARDSYLPGAAREKVEEDVQKLFGIAPTPATPGDLDTLRHRMIQSAGRTAKEIAELATPASPPCQFPACEDGSYPCAKHSPPPVSNPLDLEAIDRILGDIDSDRGTYGHWRKNSPPEFLPLARRQRSR